MRAWLTLPLLLLSTSPALADVIELKTGQRIEGTFTQGTSASISVEVAGQTLTIEVEKVRAIYFGAAPAPSTSVAPADGSTTARDAIKALRGVQSVASVGVSYREFTSRVQDAKIIVDQYVRSGQEPTPLPAIQSAMHYYVLSTRAWGLQLQRGPSETTYAALGRDQAFAACPALTPMIEKLLSATTGYQSREAKVGYLVSTPIVMPTIWTCATDKIAEAEKLLGATK